LKSHINKIILASFAAIGLASYAYAQCACTVAPPPQGTNVTTYHGDNLRTGWNQNETLLTASAFPSAFGVRHTVAVDDQVDAQPLFMSAVNIAGGTHDVVYVVTESNTVYAIDAASGAILVSRNLGAAVPNPLGCGNNPPNIGILGTPVIDPTTGILYLLTYLNSGPSYKIWALDIKTLADKIPSAVVAATHTLVGGSITTFNASVQRQRPGLLLQDGVVYAAFGSFCDFNASQSRGWILGWNASNLTPTASNETTDTLATGGYYLSAIWMSGYGIAGKSPNLYFSTGNSASGTYNGTTNIQESIVSLNENTFAINSLFTPSNHDALDGGDTDLGSGGVMLLPVQNLVLSAGKDNRLFLLSSTNLATPLGIYDTGGSCWCGPAYFVGSDGTPRVVFSQGVTLETWKVATLALTFEFAQHVATGQDPGFFTSISSNKTAPGSAIIWAVGHGNPLTLLAFNATGLNLLYSGNAGPFPNLGGNANNVPTVGNGRVYVGAYKTLTIFGAN
jgi:PQQ enzyme repeat